MKSYLLTKTRMLITINEIRQQGIGQIYRTEQNGDFNEFSDELIEIVEGKVSAMLNIITMNTEYDMIALDETLSLTDKERYIVHQLHDVQLLKLCLENYLNKCYTIIKMILNEL